ncbi:Electron transfer flavoprotein-ubiquinone oxidoreductase [subsurface metagenome]
MEQKFDAIVVGAGPAGCACAYKLAQAGLQVLVVERGKFPGAKNMWGGAFFGPALAELITDFWAEAPFERYVASHKLSCLTDEDCFSIEFTTPRFNKLPYNGFIVLRSKFDRWLASKVQEVGAIVASGLQADDLLRDGNQIVGIIAGGDKLPADVVIACDGVNSMLAQKAALRGELKPHELKQGVKEIIALPQETIERRFGLSGSEGIAWEFVGSCTMGLPGGGFIYTNKESLSIGIAVQLNALTQKQVNANDLLEGFKRHPAIARLLDGGKLVEYSAHLIPVAGINMMPKLYTDGLLVAGDAAAFVLGTGLTLEGANFAVASGVAAAETVVKAKQKGDFSASSLAYYRELLAQSFVLKDLKTFSKAPHFLENPRIYTTYPEFVCNLAEKIFTSDGKPRKRAWQLLRDTMKGKISLWQMARDLMQGRKAI